MESASDPEIDDDMSEVPTMRIPSSPIITGRDARTFLEKMNAGVVTPERLQYLQEAAEASKKAEVRREEAWKART